MTGEDFLKQPLGSMVDYDDIIYHGIERDISCRWGRLVGKDAGKRLDAIIEHEVLIPTPCGYIMEYVKDRVHHDHVRIRKE